MVNVEPYLYGITHADARALAVQCLDGTWRIITRTSVLTEGEDFDPADPVPLRPGPKVAEPVRGGWYLDAEGKVIAVTTEVVSVIRSTGAVTGGQWSDKSGPLRLLLPAVDDDLIEDLTAELDQVTAELARFKAVAAQRISELSAELTAARKEAR